MESQYDSYCTSDKTLSLLSEGADDIIIVWNNANDPHWLCAAAQLGDIDVYHKFVKHIPNLDYLKFQPTDHPLPLSIQYNHTEFAHHFMDFEQTSINTESIAYAIKWACINDSPLFDKLLSAYLERITNEEENYIEGDLLLFIKTLVRKGSDKISKFKSLFNNPYFICALDFHDELAISLRTMGY
jgi:hypothetical protein